MSRRAESSKERLLVVSQSILLVTFHPLWRVESLNKLLSNPCKPSHICCPFALGLGSGTVSLLPLKGEEPFCARASAFHFTQFSQPYTERSLPWLFFVKQHTVMLRMGTFTKWINVFFYCISLFMQHKQEEKCLNELTLKILCLITLFLPQRHL